MSEQVCCHQCLQCPMSFQRPEADGRNHLLFVAVFLHSHV